MGWTCFHCEEVWLDAGEWQYLKAQGLHTRITLISTDPYQRRLREQALCILRCNVFVSWETKGSMKCSGLLHG